MKEPKNLQYQSHSETSKEAAILKHNADTDRRIIKLNIVGAGFNGLTNDEISEKLGKDSSFYSPRLIELERMGKIVKLKDTRKTRKDRNANVYVCPALVNGRPIIPVKKIGKMPDPMIKEADKKVLRNFIGYLDFYKGMNVCKDSPIYNAVKRLAGV